MSITPDKLSKKQKFALAVHIFVWGGILFIGVLVSLIVYAHKSPRNQRFAYYWQAVNYIEGTSNTKDPDFRKHIKLAAQSSYRDAKVIDECFEMIDSFSHKKYSSYQSDKEWGFDFIPGEYAGDCAKFVNDTTEYYLNGVVRDGFFKEYRKSREEYYKKKANEKKEYHEDTLSDKKTPSSNSGGSGYYDYGPFNDPSDYDDMDDYLDDAWGYDFEEWDDANSYWEDY